MKFYFVRSGDTLSTIASLYGTTVEELIKLNDIKDPDLIYPNQPIIIPKTAQICPFPQREVKPLTEEELAIPEKDWMRSSGNTNAAYNVKNGDDQFKTAQNTTVEKMTQSSKLTNPNQVSSHGSIQVPTPAPVPTKKYMVQTGDTLFKIAQQFETTVGTLVSLNNITDPDLIYQGVEILVPAGTTLVSALE